MLASSLLILTSPPASGKTFWIRSFASEVGDESVLIISPLRALRDECIEDSENRFKVMTPEEWLLNPCYRSTVIFDEFHLHFYWGDTFRPLMWEVFYELSFQAQLTVLLTATLSSNMLETLRSWSGHFDQILWCNLGNQELKYRPIRYIRAPSKLWLEKIILQGPRGGGVNLIFCAYREEVREWEHKLTKSGATVWACVGGEAASMREKVRSGIVPDFIVCTTVLSHGVNLPSISCVYLLYPLKNVDFWIQMVARGGRRGENYEVFSLENPHGIKWRRSINFLAILVLSLKMKLNGLQRELGQWFLKE